jgi:hypothetical protein
MREKKLRLHPGYKLQVTDFMEEVELAEDFTLGDLCQVVRGFNEMDIEMFSALLQCPLELFIEECLQPCPDDDKSDLHYIRLSWSCEYDRLTETRWPPSTSLWLHIDGIGDTWEDCKPGGRFHEEGKDYACCNQYAIEMTPLHQLGHLPLRIDPVMTVRPSLTHGTPHEPLEIPAPGVTLLQLIYHVFWELSFFGTPEKRDTKHKELRELIQRIEAGEEKLIPFGDVWREFEANE